MAKIIGDEIKNIPWQEPKDDSPIWRYDNNPIIDRNPIDNVARVFNSAVVKYQDKYVGIFRGDTRNITPYLYYGESKDGIHFKFNSERLRFYDESGKEYKFEYAYDPRVVKVEDVYYIIWCDGIGGLPAIGLAKTLDFKSYTYIGHPLLPCNRNGVLFPRKIDGEFVMLSRPSDGGHTAFGDIYLSKSKDLIYWGKHQLVMKPSWEWWQGTKIGAGPAPIETDRGWLLIYHGVTRTCNGLVYSVGGALLDINDPTKVIKRCSNYLLTPEKDYETNGFVPNVTFPCATLADAKTGKIAIYYGAADTYVGLAFTTIDKILDYIDKYGY